ncbi:MAG TPA: NADH-quinone oxidoreductase subunit A [Candidatus Paceibacterota bacterium]|nr:NADH-quinone oxidoreductase subunit A [Verrucomicrobiota bacterium]HRZ47106.1 NADH-quinone oxidoreductase subunit A [Candidatus Paceibacterota bacterium]HRZ92150.1 NADH-quinone oxidoreductase subunit A [Candidatus Paceibacterota bacterium]
MVEQQIWQYAPVLILLLVALGLIGGMLAASAALGPRGRRPPIKDSAYECGMLPVQPGGGRFAVKFHRVAMLFILFDIAVVFLYPWAVVYREMLAGQAPAVLGGVLVFVGVLLVGYLHAVRKGAFDWRG